METKTETLTMQEAVEKGFTHFIEEEGEFIHKFSSINNDDIQYYKDKKCFIIDMKTPLHYSIDSNTIRDLISDHVSGQEEMSDENDNLFNIASEHDYSTLANELNSKFEAHKYFEPLDIIVTF